MSHYFDGQGRPDPNGNFHKIDGKLVLRDGAHVGGELLFMDAASKTEGPANIDEALRQRFAEMAKQKGTTVKEMLASMKQADIEETGAEVAKAFLSAQAGAGVASQYATDSTFAMDAETTYAVARARAKHDLRYGCVPPAQRPAFTVDLAAIVGAAAAKRIMAADAPNLDSLRSVARAERAAHKYVVSNAWRR